MFSVRSATASEYFFIDQTKGSTTTSKHKFFNESRTDFTIVYIRLDLQS